MSCAEALLNPCPEPPCVKHFIYVAAAALVDSDGRVLLAKRPEGKKMAGLWEFPGGKIEAGEIPEYALMRELREELGIETRPSCFQPVAFASHTYIEDDIHLMMPLYACRFWQGTIQALEHSDLAWVRPVDMFEYNMPEADIPLISQLISQL